MPTNMWIAQLCKKLTSEPFLARNFPHHLHQTERHGP
jgi:hypothetical protein